jgi:hypothetical protein
MFALASKGLAWILFSASITCSLAYACPIDVIIVKGRVDHAGGNASVRVQLVYPKDIPGESGEAKVVNGKFSIRLNF